MNSNQIFQKTEEVWIFHKSFCEPRITIIANPLKDITRKLTDQSRNEKCV